MDFSIPSLLTNGFSWQAALSAAAASKLSYSEATIVRNIARSEFGFETCEFIDINETQGFVASHANVVLVAFRGTESLGDWLGNLRLTGTTRGYGVVHSGFLGGYLVAQSAIIAALGRANVAGKRLIVTGHSLGGALAAVFAAEEFANVKVHAIYTFGQPRTGRTDFQSFFAANYPQQYFRFVNDDDIVPQVPPGYVHVGQLFHFDTGGDVQDALESLAPQVEPPPLTEAEFYEMQRQIKEVQLGVAVAGPPVEAIASAAAQDPAGPAVQIAAEETVEASVEGLFPSVSDHSMDRYLAAIRAQVIANP